MSEKNYILNCDVCDTTKMSEDLFEQYEKIMINADLLLVNERSKAILNKFPVKFHVDQVIEVEKEADVCVINGKYQIEKSQPILKDTILIVNGILTIEKQTEDILKKYVKIIVNGNAEYPQSMSSYLTNMVVNGQVECYPDNCILLKKVETLDKYFPLRAKKDAKYYASKEIIVADPDIDIQLLKNKNVNFATKRLVILEDKVSDIIDMFNDNAEISIIPNECGFINGDTSLNELILNKYGSKLYINGNLNLNLNNDSNELLKKVDYLKVEGTVNLLENQKEEFMKVDSEYQNICIAKGKEIRNKVNITIDKQMLDLAEDGVSIRNCAGVYIKPEVSKEEIVKLVQFKNCARVICTEEQKSAVEIVSTNVAYIGEEQAKEDSNDINSMMKDVLNSKVINADNYVL